MNKNAKAVVIDVTKSLTYATIGVIFTMQVLYALLVNFTTLLH